MYSIASFTNFIACRIIALLWAFSSKRGNSDVIAVGERGPVCKEAKWADQDRYSFSSSFPSYSSSSTLLSHWYSHFRFSETSLTADCKHCNLQEHNSLSFACCSNWGSITVWASGRLDTVFLFGMSSFISTRFLPMPSKSFVGCSVREIAVPWNESFAVRELVLWSILSALPVVNSDVFTAVASMRRTEALASVKFYQILSIFIFFIRLIILEDFIRLISYNGPCVRLGCSFFLATALVFDFEGHTTPSSSNCAITPFHKSAEICMTRADLGGGCRGCAPPPWDDLWFSNTTGILQKKKCWLLVLK